ncbi:MutS-related protein [Pedobacter sandarakinus]|uniref:MutS-related protein n=1 Tax=Pedobacter sandarakinus TaxID=353156 RepID=UPI0022482100|nr:DNA mismatch repair protein MutS [Pedobacter sandarakinus]MCX2573100.1 DNA mismatch repair protein MutS [Pedobacter sandarakinus]
MLKTEAQIISAYTTKIEEVTAIICQTKKLVDQLSFVRIGLFLAEILFFVLLLNSEDNGWRSLIQFLLILPVLIFVAVVRKQSQLDRQIDYQKQLLWVYQNEWNVLNDLPNGYYDGSAFEKATHPYSSDLDIFGKSSLYSLLNRCYTVNGKNLLAKRLEIKTTQAGIVERQIAVTEMLGKIDTTFDFRANLRGHDIDKMEQIKLQLKHQLGEQLSFVRNKTTRFYVAIVPYISLTLILATIFASAIFGKILVTLLIMHIGWNVLLGPKINKVFYSFGGSSNLLNGYALAISWTESHNWESQYIKNLFISKVPVSKEIKSLSKIIQNFDARLNIIVGGILNAVLLWDLKCCINLDQWYQSSSKDVVSSLNHLGDFEEIISLATLAYNKPTWAFPIIVDDFSLATENLAHPLIPESISVTNYFEFDKMPTVDVITGSNMAGKSTFLRTVGINMVLAYAAAPVCASAMQLSIFAINTYMRIKDSLTESTSTFKAELNRLKMILNNVAHDKNTLVLIDEMLRGTNSRDKYLGSKVFVEKLISEKTPALFATHDLQLADLKDEYPNRLRNFHFDIQVSDGEMRFDYKLKQGPCATFNAAILLAEIGLPVEGLP